MEIVITDTRAAVVNALRKMFTNFQIPVARKVSVRVEHGDVCVWDDGPGVCFVNGGNCVGDMSGKLDRAVLKLVPGAAKDVADAVVTHGDVTRQGVHYLPLFSALLSPGDGGRWLLTVPCMYVGGPRDMRATRNAFHATHIALSQVYQALRAGVVLRRVVMTGMCSGHGRTNRDDMALQMLEAFRAVLVDDNMVVDPAQATHPRLMVNRQYTVQPICEAHTDFQPTNNINVSVGGEHSHRAVTTSDFNPRVIRSGGSEEKSPFLNIN